MFTAEDMDNVRIAFTEAYDQSLSQYLEPDQQLKIKILAADLAHTTKPVLLLTTDGMVSMVEKIFENPVALSFIQRLSFNFFGRWTEASTHYAALSHCLAFACSGDSQSNFTATPEAIATRLVPFEKAKDVISNNRWVAIILLLVLYLRVDVK